MEKIVYRPAFGWLLFALGIMLAGLWAAYRPIHALQTGETYWTSSRYSHYTHLATHGDKVVDAFMFSFLALVGVLLLVIFFTSSLTLDRDGVIFQGIGKYANFRATYEEIQSVSRRKVRNGTLIVLHAAGKSKDLPTVYSHQDRIIAELHKRAPQLTYDPSFFNT